MVVQEEVDHDAFLLQRVRVVGEQNERGKAGGADRIALGHGFRRIADRVQLVGDVANLRRQLGHLGDAAGVVRDRAERVERDDDAGHRQHGRGRDRDVVKAGQAVAFRRQRESPPDTRADRKHRQRRCFHGDAEAGDDVGRVAGQRGVRDRLDRLELGARVVLGDDDHRGRQAEADQRRVIDAHCGTALPHHCVGNEIEGDCREYACDDHAAVQRAHDLAALRGLDEERADDRGDDRNRAEHQRVDHRLGTVIHSDQATEQHRRDDGHGIGLEQVGGHAGAVADVVADVIRDHARVARIVFRDAGLDLADQVGTDVSTLGEDTAAESCEDRNQRTAECETHERVHGIIRAGAHASEDHIVARNAEQAETDHEQAGDSATPERDVQCGIDALGCGLGGAHVGPHRDVHADVAGQSREHRADHEADGRRPAEWREPEHQRDHDADEANGRVLAIHVGFRTFLHRRGNLLHALASCRLLENPPCRNDSEQDREHGRADR